MTLVDTEKRTTAAFVDFAVNGGSGIQHEILLVAGIFTQTKQFVTTANNRTRDMYRVFQKLLLLEDTLRLMELKEFREKKG